MSDKLEDVVLKPVQAAYQATLEIAKAGTFCASDGSGCIAGDYFVNTFKKIKDCFEEVQKEINTR